MKHSAVPVEMHKALLRARPFDCEEDAIAAVIAHDIKPGDAVFIRYEDVYKRQSRNLPDSLGNACESYTGKLS